MKIFISVLVSLLLFNSVLQAQDNQLQNQMNLAIQYYNARDFEKAAPLLLNVYKISNNSSFFKFYIESLIQLERYDEAIQQIQTDIKKQKQPRAELLINWGYVLKMQHKPEESRAKYNEAIDAVQPNKNDYLIAANAFINWQEYELAKNTYLLGEKALGQGQFDYELARAYSYTRDHKNMMEKYLDLIGSDETKLQLVESSLAGTMRLDVDDELLQSFREQTLKRIQANPEIVGYNRLLIWFFLQESKFQAALRQSIALDKRTGKEQDLIFQLGMMAMNNKKFDDAINAFDYLIGKGKENPVYAQALMFKIHTSYQRYTTETPGEKIEGEKLAQQFNEVIQVLGPNPAYTNLITEYAHLLAFHLDKSAEATALINKTLETRQLRGEDWGSLKTELADIYVYSDDPWEATLVYSQVIDALKTTALGDEVKLKKAKLGYYLGNFSWAKAQLDVLKASTSKLTANDAMELSLLIGNNLNLDTTAIPLTMFARADLLYFQNKNNEAMIVLDGLAKTYPYHTLVDDILFRKAKIELEHKNYAIAADHLQKIIDGFSFDLLGDDATFMLAELYYNHLNQKEKAKELYKSVLTSFPGSVFTEESREKYRELRAIYPDKETEPIKEDLFMKGEKI